MYAARAAVVSRITFSKYDMPVKCVGRNSLQIPTCLAPLTMQLVRHPAFAELAQIGFVAGTRSERMVGGLSGENGASARYGARPLQRKPLTEGRIQVLRYRRHQNAVRSLRTSKYESRPNTTACTDLGQGLNIR